MQKKKGFTLIELIAVLVIMAIIALIVTPLVMSIIKKAKDAADRRSVDAYGRSIEIAMAGYLLDNGEFPSSFAEIANQIEYSGNTITCGVTEISEDYSVHLSECKVDGRDVKIDGDEWYTYDNSALAGSTTNSDSGSDSGSDSEPDSGMVM